MEVLMAAPKGNKFALGGNGGRPSKYKADYAARARKACEAGFTDKDLADLFGVSKSTINLWKLEHKDFSDSLKGGKENADNRVEASLYHRAIGYSYDAVKIFLDPDTKKPIYAPYREHVPPDVTACIFWLKNRRPKEWRDVQDYRHQVVNKTEEQLREEILGRLQRLGLFEDVGQLKGQG
jgi:transcriptional regulator with XRE-family HTH domain